MQTLLFLITVEDMFVRIVIKHLMKTVHLTLHTLVISTSVLLAILDDLNHYTATYAHIATQYHLSPSIVIKIFDNHVQINGHRLQKTLNIDVFYFNRDHKHKYVFMIIGFENNLIIDIVESRKHKELSSYFFAIPIAERREVSKKITHQKKHEIFVLFQIGNPTVI